MRCFIGYFAFYGRDWSMTGCSPASEHNLLNRIFVGDAKSFPWK